MNHSSASYEPGSDEWWDVTDEHGHLTGQTYRRGNPDWPPGRFHLVVATCAYRSDGAVLLTQRSATKEYPLAWEFPGGSALAGESSNDAAPPWRARLEKLWPPLVDTLRKKSSANETHIP
ncbi:NUDIX domain-containing protein [Arthrobacter monumenti]